MANTPGPMPACRPLTEKAPRRAGLPHLFEPVNQGQVSYPGVLFSQGKSGPAGAARGGGASSHKCERSVRGARPCRRAEAGTSLNPVGSALSIEKPEKRRGLCGDRAADEKALCLAEFIIFRRTIHPIVRDSAEVAKSAEGGSIRLLVRR